MRTNVYAVQQREQVVERHGQSVVETHIVISTNEQAAGRDVQAKVRRFGSEPVGPARIFRLAIDGEGYLTAIHGNPHRVQSNDIDDNARLFSATMVERAFGGPLPRYRVAVSTRGTALYEVRDGRADPVASGIHTRQTAQLIADALNKAAG